MKILKRKCASGSKEICEVYIEAASLEERDHQAVLFAEILIVVPNERPYRSTPHEHFN